MAELGQFALAVALFLSGYAIIVDVLGLLRNNDSLLTSGRNGTIASLGSLTVAIIVLTWLLVRGDFSVNYVAEHTSKTLPLAYRFSALWAGAAGSLLLWLWLQVGFIVLVFCTSKAKIGVVSSARVAANLVSVFFLLVLILDKNPFAFSAVAASDGAGLNPLLQHPAMVLHPPTLFIGYGAFAVPFAWALASLRYDSEEAASEFLKQMRYWILMAWTFLTIGIVLGAWWAYEELGWGGYWAWDPVENSSLMPWLTATALLHCSKTYQPRSAVAIWLIILCLATFSLCIFGTFLTRYGLVSSVHAFPEPGLGILFLVLIAVIWVIAAVLIYQAYRRRRITVQSPPSGGHRFIIWNNWLMVLLTFVIFVGTLFPFFSGLFTEQKISLKPDYFTKITAPGGLVLLLLIGLCPYLLRYGLKRSWRTITAALSAAAACVTWIITRAIAPACLIICGFAALNMVADFLGRYRKYKNKASQQGTITPNLRWYGARIVHIGVILVFVAMAGSGGYKSEKHVALKPDASVSIAGFDLTFKGLKADHGPNFTAVTADIQVRKDDKLIAKLNPSHAYYQKSGTSTTEVDIKRTLGYDLYTALTDVDNSTMLINLKVFFNPLINWIWIGSIVSVCGAVMILTSLYKKPLWYTTSGEESQ